MTADGTNEDSDATDSHQEHRDRSRVRAVYDEIAGHFSETRAYPWPEIQEFLDEGSVENAAVGLDLGCGNGRHAALLAAEIDVVLGVDVSRELLFEASDRMAADGWTAALLQGDAGAIPLDAETVDIAVYVATLHHLPDRETRIESLSELARVLAPGGQALVSAWSTAHDRFDESEGFDTTVEWTLPGGRTIDRFYHIYAPDEFERDLERSALDIEETFISSGNCYAKVRA